jgi:hypothetical protein
MIDSAEKHGRLIKYLGDALALAEEIQDGRSPTVPRSAAIG